MRKIPTVFKRDPDDLRRVLPEVTPGCEWVLAGEGVATRKYDGTCVMLGSDGLWFARREVKPGKTQPPKFLAVVHDPVTGKTVGWEPVGQSGFAKWHAQALANDHHREWAAGTYELCGPKVNGNPEGYPEHRLIPHAHAERVYIDPADLNYDDLRGLVLGIGVDGLEGVVWHHPDGRMAKLKCRDFAR